MNAIEQLTALLLLIDLLFGITLGMVGGASLGSRRGVLMWPATDGPISAGARVIHGVYVRDDDRYPHGLHLGSGQAAGDMREDNSSGSREQEAER